MSAARLAGVIAPLRHRDFRLLWAGQAISQLGDRVYGIALPFQLFALGATPLDLAIAATLSSGGTLLFMLLGGAVADRTQRRPLILASDLVGGVATGAVAVLAWSGELRIPHVWLAAAVLGVAEAFLAPALEAIVAELVDEQHLGRANAFRFLGSRAARTAGPAVGGLLVVIAGPATAFAVDAGTFFISFALLLAARPPRREPPAPAPLLAQVREGFAFTLARPWLWTTLVYFAIVNVIYGGQRVMTPLLVRDSLQAGAGTLGLINTAYGAGSLLGAGLLARVAFGRTGIAMYAFEIAAALATLGVGLLPVVPASVTLFMAMGVCLAASDVTWTTTIQRHVPQHLLGRVSSINIVVNSTLVPVAPLLAAALIEAVGPASTFAIAGAVGTAIAVGAFAVSPTRRFR